MLKTRLPSGAIEIPSFILSSVCNLLISSLQKLIVPVELTVPSIDEIVEVFPAPLGPKSETQLPSSMVKLMLCTTLILP